MQAINRPFTHIINGTTQFIIPVFQRDYSWGEHQCKQLWDDIVLAGRPGSDNGHFLGSIVCVPTGDIAPGFTRWLVIDGQQRLVTLTLLLTALRDHIGETNWTGSEDSPSAQKIDAYFLKNTQESGNRRSKLVLRRADDETLQSLVEPEERPAKCSDPIVDAYDRFRELLGSADPNLIYRGIARLIVIDVTLNRQTDDPQLVFESLNSTGVDLSQADLIRNFILMRLPESEQTRMYERHWSKIESLFRGSEPTLDAFIRDYMALRTRAIKQTRLDQIYRAFREEFSVFQQEDGGLEGMLRDMVHNAQYYASFNPGQPGDGDIDIALRNLRPLAPVAAILVTKLRRLHAQNQLFSEKELVRSLSLIESYVFRRAICGLETRGYWAVFAGIAHQIDDEHPFQSLQVELARLRENYRFPSDEEFRSALVEKNLYGLRVCWHLLERLENAGEKELSNTGGYSIEHVMPQNENLRPEWREMLGDDWRKIHEIWLHRLGNLTLTGYNSTYSDLPFEDKKTVPKGFTESAVRLNKFVRERQQWTAKEMKGRGEELADRSLKIWPSLDVDPSLIEKASIRHMKELASHQNVGDIQMTAPARALFDVLRHQVTSLGDVIELAESKSVSYHAPHFFLEVLPRKYELTLLLPLDLSEVHNPGEIAEDARMWKFIVNAKHDGGTVLHVGKQEDIGMAMPVVRQALNTPAG